MIWKRIPVYAASCVVLVYCLANTAEGLRGGINSDDLHNLSACTTESTPALLWRVIRIDTPAFRPSGSLFYCLFYSTAGLSPVPYRVGCLLLLTINLWLLAAIARTVTGSAYAALFAALIAAFHPRFVDLYWSTGAVYDLLCFTFCFGALWLYVSARSAQESLGPWRWSLFCGLFLLALGAKELAVALPFITFLYELIYCRRRSITGSVLCMLLLIPYLFGKLSVESPLGMFDRYQPHFNRDQFVTTFTSYILELFYLQRLPESATLILLAGTLMMTALFRNKHLLWAWSIAVLFYLPVAFIPPRAAYMVYLPFAGMALYCGVLLDAAVEHRRWARPALLVLCLCLAMRAHRVQRTRMGGDTLLGQPLIRILLRDLEHARFAPPKGATVLVVNDPYPTGQHSMILLLRLYARDPDLEIERSSFDDGRAGPVVEWRQDALLVR